MIEQGDSELDSMLRDVFPHAGKSSGRTRIHLPGFHERVTVHSTGDSTGADGAPGAAPGSPPDQPVLLGDQPISALQQLLEHLQIQAALAPHQAPPFQANAFDVFNTAAVNLAGGGYGGGSFTKLVAFTLPEAFEGLLSFVGQQAETMAAYQDIQWRIRLDQKALSNYSNIRSQLFQLAPPGGTIFVPLKGGQTIDLYAASLSATSYNVWGRLMGYYWPARFSEGESSSRSMV